MNPRIIRIGKVSVTVLAAAIGWVCVMVSYFAIYDAFENYAVPVSLPSFKYFL
jgi:hypothetical protein